MDWPEGFDDTANLAKHGKFLMNIRRLQTRFILAGGLLVMTTVVCGIWSALTFARLSTVVGNTLRENQETVDLTAVLASALEREDDALLLAVNDDVERARRELVSQRQRFDESYSRLLGSLSDREEQDAAVALRRHVDAYRAAGDALLAAVKQPDAGTRYHEQVNPALRQAVGDCAKLRELNFRSMQLAGIRARDEAQRATVLVAAISAGALGLSTFVAVLLARTVLWPIRDLTTSVEALRLGDFERRVGVNSADELGQLADGFNRMAEALAEFRRSNLGEVLRANETLEATLAALPDAVIVVDPDGQVISMNSLARAVLQATGSERPERLEDLPFPTQGLRAIRDALRGERTSETRAELSRAFSVSLDGRQRKFLLMVVPIAEFAAGRCGAVAVLYDVTDVVRLDELRMELVAVASHELKTPLTTLRMNLLLLGERAENLTPRQQEVLTTAVLGCQELASTIDELLDLTRIEAGQLRLAQDMVDLYAVIEQAVYALRPRYDDAAITLRIIRDCRQAIVRGDAARLGLVFSNLLTNTLKYTPRGGAVVIRVASRQNAVEDGKRLLHIAVMDTGPGIPAEFHERVFEKFFRIEQHRGSDPNGTRGAGIGLYLCRQIIEAHGGMIWCEPGDEGRGTRIAFLLKSEMPNA
jgi:NtrC-family two-component system sensor histidine kinase KinB